MARSTDFAVDLEATAEALVVAIQSVIGRMRPKVSYSRLVIKCLVPFLMFPRILWSMETEIDHSYQLTSISQHKLVCLDLWQGCVLDTSMPYALAKEND